MEKRLQKMMPANKKTKINNHDSKINKNKTITLLYYVVIDLHVCKMFAIVLKTANIFSGHFYYVHLNAVFISNYQHLIRFRKDS